MLRINVKVNKLITYEVKLLKTEKEIRNEIEACDNTIKNYKNAYKKKEISKRILKSELLQSESMKFALKWVLDENDRYD